ncbi:YtzI protein [Mesobacillus thioparans]|uniref:YtzI protein n=1 Tax=Mesobacillus thioparans TaxID=370439 RepID=UPI0039F0E953
MYTILIISVIIVIVVLVLSVLTTSKAYQYKHTIDPIENSSEDTRESASKDEEPGENK